MTIELRFVREADLSSPIIAWFGGNLGYSHVGAVLPVGSLRPVWWPRGYAYGRTGYELGARLRANRSLSGKAGVQLRPLDYARFTRQCYVSLPASEEQTARFWALWSAQLGCPYSWRTILGFALGREIHDHGAWDCSTGIAWATVGCGVFPEALRPHLQQITPDALWLACAVYPGAVCRTV
ncbi:MAG: hypothetical protein KGL35_08820 [Bradyrhizobium sp.]|nr:hypothetical protein [Bradyrhizobium sp.]